MTMEQRLESLSAELAEIEKSSAADPNAIASAAVLGETPTASSLVTLMDQALQSGDDALLEQCLGCEDATVVDGTARRLPPARVVQLLKKLMAKFEKRPSRGVLLTRWLVAVLRSHTAFLMGIPDLSSQLAGLSQMLENRLATYAKLAALGGRLDLLMSQVSSRAGGDSVQEEAKKEPRKVYRED
jgi:U3 small nucleolar RNA-associated protein 5